MMNYWNGGWHMGGMGLFWILILAAIAIVAWFLFAQQRSGSTMTMSTESPEQILKRRYAKGELDRQDYDRMMNDLRR